MSGAVQVLVLTHRRAALVAAMQATRDNEVLPVLSQEALKIWNDVANAFKLSPTLESSHALALFSQVLTTPSQQHPGFRLYSNSQCAVAVGEMTTAEVLGVMYDAVLATCEKTDADVSDVRVGVGPGSFTGLRLGCAFVNGLQCGRQRRLWALPNATLEMLCAAREKYLTAGLSSPFWQQELPQVGDDEFAVPVTLMDFLFALLQWSYANEVPVLQPAYGRLPGPVLKLQEALLTLEKSKR